MNKDRTEIEQLSADSEPAARALGGLAELARQELPPAVSPRQSALAYARFMQSAPSVGRVAAGAPRRRRAAFLLAAGTVAIAVVMLGVGVATWKFVASRSSLNVEVAGGVVDEGGFVRAAATAAPRLRFSDGTEIDLEVASRARVTETTRHGARVLLDDGRARARVVHRKGSQWLFDAGPCRVQVTGTQFEMRWSAAEQVLNVMLYNGSVVVMGPPAVGGVPMRAGQNLVMDVRHNSVQLTDMSDGAARPSAAPSGTGTSISGISAAANDTGRTREEPGGIHDEDSAPAASGAAVLQSRHSDGAGPGGWHARVLSGQFRGVIDEAQRRGLRQVLRQESPQNLMALADAARYAGSLHLASRTLLNVRKRFPHTTSADRAAFLLGRLAEDQHGNLKNALQWYETYLADAPADAFTAEATGRRMTATLRLGNSDRARALAGEYLRRYPQGAYARAAQAILSP